MFGLEQLHPLPSVGLISEDLGIGLLNVLLDTRNVHIRWERRVWGIVVNGRLSIMHMKDLVV